jgi:HK97 family phage major capsid protein
MTRYAVGAERWREDPKGGFESLTAFFGSVRRYFTTAGRSYDERLKPLAVGHDGPLAAAGSDEQGVYSDPHGGFLAPEALLGPVRRVPPGADPMSATTPLIMPAARVKIPARVDRNHSSSVTGGIVISRTQETVDAVASRGELEQVTFEANSAIGLTFVSDRLTDGAAPMLEEWLARCYEDAFVNMARTERLFGTGTGEGLGVLNSPCLITVAKEAGQAADTIVKANIDNMEARSWDYGRATWVANYNTRPQLKSLVQVVGTGGNAVPYLTCVDGQELLDGRPIYFTDIAKTLGDRGDVVLGVWAEYVDATYKPLELAASMHVRLIQGEVAFRAWTRCDFRPWWRSALTPKNGTLTLSPFVTLAERA